jgi:hypothetical protein
MTKRPGGTEAAEYYFTYIDQVPDGDILATLVSQTSDTIALLRGISEDDSLKRYAPDKWTIREVVSHVNDTERAFAFRALWFARGFEDPLPSYDQNIAIATADANSRSLKSHIGEFVAVRSATQTLFANLPEHAWSRRGIASGNPFTVRAMAFITAGHVAHHVRILRERYL